MDAETFITPEAVRVRLGLKRLETVYALLDSGRLAGYRVGRLWRISEADYAAYLESVRSGVKVKRKARRTALPPVPQYV